MSEPRGLERFHLWSPDANPEASEFVMVASDRLAALEAVAEAALAVVGTFGALSDRSTPDSVLLLRSALAALDGET